MGESMDETRSTGQPIPLWSLDPTPEAVMPGLSVHALGTVVAW
jgi:hypothetical protein